MTSTSSSEGVPTVVLPKAPPANTASPEVQPQSPLDEVVAEYSGALGFVHAAASIDQQLLDCHRFDTESGAPTPAAGATLPPCPPHGLPPLESCPPTSSAGKLPAKDQATAKDVALTTGPADGTAPAAKATSS